jgi:AcrR family transcriptional regulator
MQVVEKKTRTRGRYHHGDLHAALIDAGFALLQMKTVEEFSVAEAARSAGVSSAAPYRHFADRNDYLTHIAAAGFDRLLADMQVALEDCEPGSIESLIAIGCTYIQFGANHPELFHLMWGTHRHLDIGDVKHEAAMRAYGAFIQTMQAAMQRHGFGDADPHSFGAPLWAMVHGFAALLIGRNPKVDPDMDRMRQRVDVSTRAYFDGMTGKQAP